MGWGRIAGFAAFFGLGVAVGGATLRATISRSVDLPEAQRRALQLLDQTPASHAYTKSPVVAAVRRIEPAVVNIDTVGRTHKTVDSDSPWPVDSEVRGKGSGVIITSDGYIVTNNHVVDGANRIRVTLPDGHWYYAHPIGRDIDNDLAVIRVDARNLPTAQLGNSDQLQVGEQVLAVGNPLGLGSTVTSGIVSALNRSNLQLDEGRKLDGAIQTDAPINKGNSGGALADITGSLIGINTAILSAGPNGGSIGLGFAIPVNSMRRIVRDLIAQGKTEAGFARQPWIGVALSAVPENYSAAFHLAPNRGVLILRVEPETPASIAGLEDNDIILSIDGKAINELRQVRQSINKHRSGDRILVHVLRPSDQREMDIPVIIQERPESVSLSG